MTVKCPRCGSSCFTLELWSGDTFTYVCGCGRELTEKEYNELEKAEHDREIFIDAVEDIDSRLERILDAIDGGDSQ
jgi:hypothetical protein